jgi:general secretion pathway protein G
VSSYIRTFRLPSLGFTLIELVVTLFILAILASAAVPLTQMTIKRHREEDLRRALYTIRDALDAFKKASAEGHIATDPLESGYPKSLRVLVAGVPDAMSTNGRKLYFLRRVPADPFDTEDSGPSESAWGIRSYASEADDPKAGDDVYDVYSRSDGIGLNGRPYRQW